MYVTSLKKALWDVSRYLPGFHARDLLIGAIAKIVHLQVKLDVDISVAQTLHAVLRHERHVINRVEFIDKLCHWVRCGIIVHQPAGDVVV